MDSRGTNSKNLQSDVKLVRDEISKLKLIIVDLVAIIIEYYPNICGHKSTNTQCETLCDIGSAKCVICRSKYYGETYKSVFKTSVRLEPINKK